MKHLTFATPIMQGQFLGFHLPSRIDTRPVRWLVLVLVWAGWCWFFVRGKYCWLADLGWLKPTSEQADYGELVTNSQSHPVGNRTPRIPVLAPTDRSATDDATSELKNAICSTKRNNDRVSNDCANFSINEFSLDGRSRIMESTKGVEYQTFLTKGTGDTDIFQNQQPLKRKGMDQIMDRGQTSTAGHETLMEVREGNKPVGLLKAEQMFDEYISSDDMLILNVFQSLVSAADKMSKVKINFPSGTLRSETTLSDTDRKDEGISLVDVSKHGKPVDECSAYKANKKKHTELLDAEESCMPLY